MLESVGKNGAEPESRKESVPAADGRDGVDLNQPISVGKARALIEDARRAGSKVVNAAVEIPRQVAAHARRAFGPARAACAYIEECISNPQTANQERAGWAFEKLLEAGAAAGKLGARAADSALDQISGDPSKPQRPAAKGARLALGLVPIVGSAQNLGQARFYYRSSLAATDPAEKERLLHQARRECLAACASGSLDVLTLGTARVAAESSKAWLVGKNAVQLLLMRMRRRESSERKSGRFEAVGQRIFEAPLDLALKSETLREAMDNVLKRISALDANRDMST
jgi:hypothetical protein